MSEKEDLLKIMNLLLDAVYRDCGLAQLSELAADIMKNPVYIVDMSDRILSACHQIKTSDTYLREMMEIGYIAEHESSKMRRNNLRKKIQDACAPFIAVRPKEAGGERFIFTPIKFHGELVASGGTPHSTPSKAV